jgi:hypothetical protein
VVHDEQVVRPAAFQRRLVGSCGLEAFGEATGHARRRHPIGDGAGVFTGLDRFGCGRERVTVNQHLAATVGQDELQFGCRKAGIQGHGDRPDLGRPVEQATEFDRIGHQQRHAITLADPQ